MPNASLDILHIPIAVIRGPPTAIIKSLHMTSRVDPLHKRLVVFSKAEPRDPTITDFTAKGCTVRHSDGDDG